MIFMNNYIIISHCLHDLWVLFKKTFIMESHDDNGGWVRQNDDMYKWVPGEGGWGQTE